MWHQYKWSSVYRREEYRGGQTHLCTKSKRQTRRQVLPRFNAESAAAVAQLLTFRFMSLSDVSQMIRTSFSHLPLTDAQTPPFSVGDSRLTISPDDTGLGIGIRAQIEIKCPTRDKEGGPIYKTKLSLLQSLSNSMRLARSKA